MPTGQSPTIIKSLQQAEDILAEALIRRTEVTLVTRGGPQISGSVEELGRSVGHSPGNVVIEAGGNATTIELPNISSIYQE